MTKRKSAAPIVELDPTLTAAAPYDTTATELAVSEPPSKQSEVTFVTSDELHTALTVYTERLETHMATLSDRLAARIDPELEQLKQAVAAFTQDVTHAALDEHKSIAQRLSAVEKLIEEHFSFN